MSGDIKQHLLSARQVFCWLPGWFWNLALHGHVHGEERTCPTNCRYPMVTYICRQLHMVSVAHVRKITFLCLPEREKTKTRVAAPPCVISLMKRRGPRRPHIAGDSAPPWPPQRSCTRPCPQLREREGTPACLEADLVPQTEKSQPGCVVLKHGAE